MVLHQLHRSRCSPLRGGVERSGDEATKQSSDHGGPKDDLDYGDATVESLEDDPVAQMIFDNVDDSSGPRPSIIIDPNQRSHERAIVLFRDGKRPHLPFNLILGPDPEQARATVAENQDI